MMRADVHMHTNFSHDSKSAPEEMILGAIAKGLQAVCFTDHHDKDDFAWGPEEVFEPEEYFKVMPPLRDKYKDKFDVRIAVENGLQPYLEPFYREFVKKYPFDFVIGSVHSTHKLDIAHGEIFDGKTDEEVYREVLEEMLEDVRIYENYDVLGHLDYMIRYGKDKEQAYSYLKYAELIDEILKNIIAKGKGLELNMAGLKYGLPYAHPHPDVLKRYRELGGEIITVGADGHCPEHIAWDFDKANGILRACGFTYYTEFKQRKPVFKQLS